MQRTRQPSNKELFKMIFQKTTFVRLFSTGLKGGGLSISTNFGFDSGRKRFFDVTIPGRPRIEQGMTVVALLENPDEWEGEGLLGWVDCADGSIACDSAPHLFGTFLFYAFFASVCSARVFDVIGSPEGARFAAALVIAVFGGISLRFLYFSVKALLVWRALVVVRDLCRNKV